jgi:hypothetical protein
MLRRSQKDLDLPGRTDLKVFLEFDDQERLVYNAARDKTMISIDDLVSSHHSSESYLNALQKINSLRLICNLGISKIEGARMQPQCLLPRTTGWDELTARQALMSLPLAGVPVICTNCAVAIDTLFNESEELVSLKVTSCLRIWCLACRDSVAYSDTPPCACHSGCSTIVLNLATLPTLDTDILRPLMSGGFPTKIRTLTRDLSQHSPHEKW